MYGPDELTYLHFGGGGVYRGHLPSTSPRGFTALGLSTSSSGAPTEIVIIPSRVPLFPALVDYGDALDAGGSGPNYPTTQDSDGARHIIRQIGPRLGKLIDADSGELQNFFATADDEDQFDDEDGVRFLTPVLPDCVADIEVELTGAQTARLDAWLNFNLDGDWNDPGEKILDHIEIVEGTNQLSFFVTTASVHHYSYSRFRVSSAGGLQPIGLAGDGEVEDYRVAMGVRLLAERMSPPDNPVEVRLSWPDSCQNYQVEFTPDVDSDTWEDRGPGTLAEGIWQMNVTQAGFYRLQKL